MVVVATLLGSFCQSNNKREVKYSESVLLRFLFEILEALHVSHVTKMRSKCELASGIIKRSFFFSFHSASP